MSTHSFVFLATSLGLNFSVLAPPRTAPTGGFGVDDERLSNLPGGGAMGADGAGSAVGVTVPVEGCEASAWAAALRRATGFGFTLRPGGILVGFFFFRGVELFRPTVKSLG